MTKEEIDDLLYSVPAQADYAVEAMELDSVDIDPERVRKLMDIIAPPVGSVVENYVRFDAARLLCGWSYDEGFERLCDFIYDRDLMENNFREDQRLRGYNISYQQALSCLVRYWAVKSDNGSEDVARCKIFEPITYIIKKAETHQFEINSLNNIIKYEKYEEYYQPLREYMLCIVNDSDMNRWKIIDGLKILRIFDPILADNLQRKYNIPED